MGTCNFHILKRKNKTLSQTILVIKSVLFRNKWTDEKGSHKQLSALPRLQVILVVCNPQVSFLPLQVADQTQARKSETLSLLTRNYSKVSDLNVRVARHKRNNDHFRCFALLIITQGSSTFTLTFVNKI